MSAEPKRWISVTAPVAPVVRVSRAAPDGVVATGRAFPGRSRPLCPHPQHAHYKGTGNPDDAASFECR